MHPNVHLFSIFFFSIKKNKFSIPPLFHTLNQTYEGKLNFFISPLFYPLTIFPFSQFSTPNQAKYYIKMKKRRGWGGFVLYFSLQCHFIFSFQLFWRENKRWIWVKIIPNSFSFLPPFILTKHITIFSHFSFPYLPSSYFSPSPNIMQMTS